MDYDRIKQQYPKSYEKFIHEWYCGYKDLINNRDLYDLFDENGIIIGISSFYRKDYGFRFSYTIEMEDLLIDTDFEFNSRTQAESAVFSKAFEILEQKL